MNKRDLIDALSGRLGDKKSATEALNAVLETIQSAVADGDKVAITGFGVFEKSDRPARTARNPATGAEIQVAAQSVPKFRPGADFKALVNGGGDVRPNGTQAFGGGLPRPARQPRPRRPASASIRLATLAASAPLSRGPHPPRSSHPDASRLCARFPAAPPRHHRIGPGGPRHTSSDPVGPRANDVLARWAPGLITR